MDALLLSGGIDSIALAAWLRPWFGITINYGQLSARAEICAAEHVASQMGIRHFVIHVDCASLGSGDLVGGSAHSLAPASDWWPFRNQLLLTISAMHAVRLGVKRLLLGT